MAAARQYSADEAQIHFSKILEAVATGEEVIISKSGEPVAKVIPLAGRPRRGDFGALKGRIPASDDFDDLPEAFDEAFGDDE
ncbi:type II toxin-antitoxin system prevent-host-death family antitoxin [Streptomyces sp. SR27]|uniref:type II toxin-antitoxin system Phd/YefM family antitoxin n=1 Tax=unclassified Streptomyces TaxID=2593676 RepID=UPI00295A807F|nr:type II toxin-antitoxin system prevent-host-death family antitoxin [Streptomyces sp. SR27]MDV9191554.1 type II toxin-antitoxin system prevent-host-death family antitoxin [Streptomyces sp. SR27]